MNTKKSLSLFILVMFIMYSITAVSFVYFPGDLAMSDKTEKEETINNQSLDNFIHFSSLLPQPIIENTLDTETWYPGENTLDTDTWYPGESVKITENFIDGYLLPETLSVSAPKEWDGYDIVRPIQSDLFRIYSSDNGYAHIGWYSTSGFASGAYYTAIEYSIDFGGTEGEFQIEYKLYVYDSTTWEDWTPTEESKSMDIDSSYVSSNYKVRVLHKIWWDFGNGGFHSVYLLNLDTGSWVEVGSQDGPVGTVADFSGQKIAIDVVKVDGDLISSDIRTELRYSTPTKKMHKIDYWVFSGSSTLYLYVSSDYEFVSVNPTCTVEKETDYYEVTNVLVGSYTFLFISNCSYHLTIEDKSSTYLQDVGFENAQYLNDWTTNGTASTTTAQWFDGYYSLQTHNPELMYREFFADNGDECDFEEDVDEFDIKLSGLDVLTTITHAGEDKLHLEETTGYVIGNGARRDNLAINTNTYTTFGTEIYLYKVFKPDRVKITLHFSDASTQDHTELISSGNTVAFNFTITSDKTISDIDIYYGDASWNNGVGDKIYVSYIKIFHEWIDPYELSLSLPLDDYYFNFGVRCEGTTTINIAEIERDIEITLLDTWEQVFYYAHTDSVTLSITPYSLTSLVFFDNFKIAQTSTTITTNKPSENLISSSLHAWDGRMNHIMPNIDFEIELWDRTAQTLEYSYNVTTNDYGVATVEHNYGLEQKEYTIKTLCFSSDFVLSSEAYYYDQPTEDQDLTDWGNVNIVGTFTESFDSSNTKYGDVSYKVIMDDANADGGFQYVSDYSIELNDYDKLCFWMDSSVALSGTGEIYVWGPLGYTQGGLTTSNKLDFYTGWTFYSIDLRDYFTISNASIFDDAMYFRFDVDYDPLITVYMDDLHFQHAVKLYFTPSEPSQTDFAETELNDAWDWTEGDDDSWIAQDLEVYTIENGLAIAETNALSAWDGIVSYTDYSISSDYYTSYLRVKANRTQNTGYWVQTDVSARMVYFDITTSWQIFEIDLSAWIGEEVTETRIQTTAIGNPIKIEFDFIKFIHKDSWLEETNDYATDELSDAWDFEEYDTGTVLDGWQKSVGGQTIELEDGCFKVDITATDAYTRILAPSLSIDASIYTQIVITIKTNEDNLQLYFAESGNNGITTKVPIGVANAFHTLVFDINSGYWAGTETALYIWLYDSDGNFEADEFFWIDSIKLLSLEEIPYTVIQNYAGLESETNDLLYNVWVDFQYFGVYTDLSLVPLYCGYSGQHYLQIQPFKQDDCYITQNIYTYYYFVSESGIMKIIIHDQSSNVMNFDQFKVYVEGYRLYDNYMYFTDSSLSFNLTINDLFDNQMYTNSSEVFEEFKQIQLTLFSVKIQNIQENPIYFRIERGDKYYSEWIFTYEVVEYFLEEATYTIWVYYSDVDGEFAVSENGTVVNYNYYIDDDTAIRITGYSIEDVWGNVVNLINDLDAVNASLSNQIIEVDIHIENVNTSIINQVVDVEIYLTNVNTTLGSQILSIQTDLINLNTTLFTQTVSILTEIANVNTTLFDQTVLLLTDIANVNTTLYTQTLTILSDLTNINSTIFSQTVSILTLIENVNTTLFEQTLTVIAGISNMNSTLFAQTIEILTVIENINSTLFVQTVEILNQISNVNTTLFAQTVSILTEISNINATLFDQTVLLLTDIANVNTTLYSQTLTILSDLTNINSTIFSQTISILTLIENVNSTLFEQTLTVIAGISNMNSTIFAQTVQILTVIENINSTLFIQTIEILNQISNINTTLFAQTIAILTELDLHNDTVVMYVLQNQQLLAELEIYNTMFHQTYFTLTTLTGVGLDFITAAVYINNTRIYDSKQIYYNDTYLKIEVRDYFGNLLYSYNCRIINDIDLNLPINLILQTFENPYDVAIEIALSNIHNDTTIISWVIPPHSTISVYILASSYDITITPLASSFTNTTHTIYYEPQTIEFQDLGSKQTYSVECVTSAKPLPGFVSSEEKLKQAQTLIILSLLLNAFLLAFTSMVIKWGVIRVINVIMLPIMHLLRLLFDFTPKALVRDEGGLRFVDLDQYQKLKKREEKGMI